ncbi:S-adenosyl-L-methionine-dependent methyltransferase [Xylariaceae sp. FL0662B]|nr:S-adenosyl-L-methionine-dependent methyltransferase [Xylariaceae sp. FL0662B]
MALGEGLVDTLNGITSKAFEGNEVARLQLADTARKLFERLETKEEKVYRLTFEQPVAFAALQTTVDLGLWDAWTASGGGEKSVEELAKLSKHDVEINLLRRLLRLLGATNIIEETGEDRYKPTEFSFAIGDKSSLIAQSIQCRTHHWSDSARNLPGYLAKTNYREPLDAKNNNYSDAFPEKQDFFARCVANPAYQESFSAFMTAWAKYKKPWPEFYDTKSLLEGADLSNGNAFVIDVGGHHGVDLIRVLEKHPELPAGSLILQDLPEVVASAKVPEKIKVVGHSFFDPQPVKGARAYYFHAVFHDWPDNVAVDILKNTAAAMKPGYSKLLINDIVIPPTGTSSIQATMDCEMMAALSAHERTEAMWKKLITEAGFKLIKFWKDGRGNESLVEAELA